MGCERYDELVIGFVVDVDDALKPFVVTVPERVRFEKRFSPKTGKEVDPVKVVEEEEHDEYEVDGERFTDKDEVFDRLCKKVGATWHWLIKDDETDLIALEPKHKNLKLEAKNMARLCEDARQIRTLFKKNWGIELEEPKIQTVEIWG